MRAPVLFHFFTPVSRIKGVGGATSEALTRLLPASTQISGGVPLVRDLLFHLPTGIVDRRVTFPLHSAPEGVTATFVVKVDRYDPPKNSRFSKKLYRVICSNETGTLTLVFFNAREDYIKGALPLGSMRVVSGETQIFDYERQMTHPDIIAPVSELAAVQTIEAVYPLTVGMTSRRIAKLVDEALAKMEALPEWQSDPAVSFTSALVQSHHPQTREDISPICPARERLAYDEILAHQLQLALLRQKMQRQQGAVITGDESLTTPLMKTLPYRLTAGQQQVLADISADMASGHRMTRLLQGDVGSGKTIVALISMLKVVEEGGQCALMAPTELIAQQHFTVIMSYLQKQVSSTNDTVLLTGSITGKARETVLSQIQKGDAKIIIGTHALFQEQVQFANLALVVIDEQHRFGVEQRMALTKKGEYPHILHMTATPIPRSLTMMLYGDMDCSRLTEKPAERKPVITRIIPRSRYDEVVTRLQSALGRGEKAYWICPLVESQMSTQGADTDLAAATLRYTEFKARFGPIVSLVHGRMNADARTTEMQKFARGESRLLVATTVVEVGVDVRDATIMVIEQAERFGLSQLHQLRGRVGRGEKESRCVLLYTDSPPQSLDKSTVLSEERLRILRETDNGFIIAEEDLKLRGGGELLGVRQSGAMPTMLFEWDHHTPLIERARNEAADLLAADPQLTTPRGQAAQILLQLFERDAVL